MKQPTEAMFRNWSATLVEYRQRQYAQIDVANPANFKQDTDILRLFSTILSFSLKGNMAKDMWSDFAMPHSFGQTLIKKSAKHETEYEFGICNDCFIIKAAIVSPTYLRLMPNSYWQSVLDLQKAGAVRFEPGDQPKIDKSNRDQVEIFRSETSVPFVMIRNYIALMERQRGGLGDILLGNLEVSWPVDTPIRETFARAEIAFSTLYKLNNQLYSLSHADFRRNMKKHFLSLDPEAQAKCGGFDVFLKRLETH